jgi:hypothetical protein
VNTAATPTTASAPARPKTRASAPGVGVGVYVVAILAMAGFLAWVSLQMAAHVTSGDTEIITILGAGALGVAAAALGAARRRSD